eukprot:7146313-Pyramimonas_sp.AAC.1
MSKNWVFDAVDQEIKNEVAIRLKAIQGEGPARPLKVRKSNEKGAGSKCARGEGGGGAGGMRGQYVKRWRG